MLLKGELTFKLYKWIKNKFYSYIKINEYSSLLSINYTCGKELSKHVFVKKIISEPHLREERSLIHCINFFFF